MSSKEQICVCGENCKCEGICTCGKQSKEHTTSTKPGIKETEHRQNSGEPKACERVLVPIVNVHHPHVHAARNDLGM
ncbi:14573_t:CDS:2 [Funneliformis mosseae]|uniref:14573_t:CDS:1 n=1 Tax=Funneliformis mosseae TaxID=27381 RepID=A0A9N9CMQ5_FUNMO|nr:14573_t:CDS:2 [Funneliformis mosseae]